MTGREKPCRQGRARGLYDEQLQRQQQERLLIRSGAFHSFDTPAFFGREGSAVEPDRQSD